jgi:protease IV
MNEAEKKFAQQGVDRIYLQFKQRVATGRKKDINYIDSVAQGRVWSGEAALRLGLVDRLGNLTDAIACAARMAKLESFRLRELPESESWLNDLLDRKSEEPSARIRAQIGEQNFRVYKQMLDIKELCDAPQARLPFQFLIH